MSTVNVRVNTDSMLNQSNLVKEDVEKIDTKWKSIADLIKGSKGYWEGEASDAHIKAFKEIEDDVEMVIKRLGENVITLQKDAGIYESANAAIEGEIGNLKVDIFK